MKEQKRTPSACDRCRLKKAKVRYPYILTHTKVLTLSYSVMEKLPVVDVARKAQFVHSRKPRRNQTEFIQKGKLQFIQIEILCSTKPQRYVEFLEQQQDWMIRGLFQLYYQSRGYSAPVDGDLLSVNELFVRLGVRIPEISKEPEGRSLGSEPDISPRVSASNHDMESSVDKSPSSSPSSGESHFDDIDLSCAVSPVEMDFSAADTTT